MSCPGPRGGEAASCGPSNGATAFPVWDSYSYGEPQSSCPSPSRLEHVDQGYGLLPVALPPPHLAPPAQDVPELLHGLVRHGDTATTPGITKRSAFGLLADRTADGYIAGDGRRDRPSGEVRSFLCRVLAGAWACSVTGVRAPGRLASITWQARSQPPAPAAGLSPG